MACLSSRGRSTERERGPWPEALEGEERNAYGLAAIRAHLRTFVWRFFKTSQFKRSCVPNGPKVGSIGSRRSTTALSNRNDEERHASPSP